MGCISGCASRLLKQLALSFHVGGRLPEQLGQQGAVRARTDQAVAGEAADHLVGRPDAAVQRAMVAEGEGASKQEAQREAAREGLLKKNWQ